MICRSLPFQLLYFVTTFGLRYLCFCLQNPVQLSLFTSVTVSPHTKAMTHDGMRPGRV